MMSSTSSSRARFHRARHDREEYDIIGDATDFPTHARRSTLHEDAKKRTFGHYSVN